jgi:hypothetical protein
LFFGLNLVDQATLPFCAEVVCVAVLFPSTPTFYPFFCHIFLTSAPQEAAVPKSQSRGTC